MPPPPSRPPSPQPLLHRILEYHFGDFISLMDGTAQIPSSDHGYTMFQIRAMYAIHFVGGALLGWYSFPFFRKHGPVVWFGAAFLFYCYSNVSWWLWGKDMHGDYLRLREERRLKVRVGDEEARVGGKDGGVGKKVEIGVGGSGKEGAFREGADEKKEKREG